MQIDTTSTAAPSTRSLALLTILIIIALIGAVHGIEIIALLPLYLEERFNDGGTLAGILISAYLLVDIAVRPPAGWLADQIDRRYLLVAGLLLSLLVVLLLAIAGSLEMLVAAVLLNGLGAGLIWPAMYALLADMYGRRQRGMILGLVNMVMLGGLGLGPIAGNLLLQGGRYGLAFWVCAIVLGVALLAGLNGIRQIRPVLTDGNEGGETFGQQPSGGPTTRTSLFTRNIILLAIMGLCMSLAVSMLIPILNRYGTEILNISLASFAFVLLPPGLVTATLLIPLGHLADRFGRKLPIVSGLLLLSAVFWASPVSTVPWIVSLGGCIAGAGYALCVPAWNALIMDAIPEQRRGTMLGWIAALQAAGGALGPALSGFVWEHTNPFASFLGAAIFFTLALFFSFWLRERAG